MALMDAKEYDPRPMRRRVIIAAFSLAAIIVLLIFWFWPTGRFITGESGRLATTFSLRLSAAILMQLTASIMPTPTGNSTLKNTTITLCRDLCRTGARPASLA